MVSASSTGKCFTPRLPRHRDRRSMHTICKLSQPYSAIATKQQFAFLAFHGNSSAKRDGGFHTHHQEKTKTRVTPTHAFIGFPVDGDLFTGKIVLSGFPQQFDSNRSVRCCVSKGDAEKLDARGCIVDTIVNQGSVYKSYAWICDRGGAASAG